MATILFGINPLSCFLLASLVGASFLIAEQATAEYGGHNDRRRPSVVTNESMSVDTFTDDHGSTSPNYGGGSSKLLALVGKD